MANFNGPETAMAAGFKPPNNLLCLRCGEYGRASFAVFVEGRDGKNVHAVNSEVCIYCKTGVRRGSLIGLFTGSVAKPDFTCRGAKLPEGCSMEVLHRALEKEPLRRWFHHTELAAKGRNQLF